jgi:hypothetical protein
MALWRRPKGRHEAGAPTRPSEAVPAVISAPEPRVELTFTDGSSTSLDADAARALADVARVLTRRD